MIEKILWRTFQVVFLTMIFPLVLLVFIPVLAVFEAVYDLHHLFRCFFPEKEPKSLFGQRSPELEVLSRNQNEAKKRLTRILTTRNGDFPLQEDEPGFREKRS